VGANGNRLAFWVLGSPASGDLPDRDDLMSLTWIAALAALQLERERAWLSGVRAASGSEEPHNVAEDLSTPREQEVMALLARGYSNRRIADELIIGVRTAETHVQRILRKLGLDNRAQAVGWARDDPSAGRTR
jgi:DNA-binding NarL/FixJ family response regulator